MYQYLLYTLFCNEDYIDCLYFQHLCRSRPEALAVQNE
jgi:hypothetical protein